MTPGLLTTLYSPKTVSLQQLVEAAGPELTGFRGPGLSPGHSFGQGGSEAAGALEAEALWDGEDPSHEVLPRRDNTIPHGPFPGHHPEPSVR